MLVLSGLGWGMIYSLNRFAVTGGIPFIPYVLWMGVGAALLLLILGALLGGLPKLQWAHIKAYLVLGIISYGLSYTVLAVAAPNVPAGVLSLGATLTPILTYPAAALLKLDRFRLVRTLGLVAGLAAVALIVVPEASLPSPDMVPWVLLGMVTPLLYVANAIIIALLQPPPSGTPRPVNPSKTSNLLLEDDAPLSSFDRDRSLTESCRAGRFRQQREHLYIVRLGGFIHGAVVGGRRGLYDPEGLAVPGLVYALRWQDTGRCEVYVVRHLQD